MALQHLNTRWILVRATALLLWLLTAAAGLVEVLLVPSTLVSLYARFGTSYSVAHLIRDVAVVILALAWLAFAVGTAEYHRTRVGQARSWKLFAWTIGVEVGLLVLYFVV